MKQTVNSVYIIFFVLAIFLIVFGAGTVSAHRIYVDVNSQIIEIEAYYGDGKPAQNADVTVYKSNGEVYLTNKTDENGKFKFDVKDVDSDYLTIEVEQLGHKSDVKIGTGVESDSSDEMPLYIRVIAGFGYLMGMAGIACLYLAWKRNKNIKNEVKK